jgi:hypothetical protein
MIYAFGKLNQILFACCQCFDAQKKNQDEKFAEGENIKC